MVVDIQSKFEKELRKTPQYIQEQALVVLDKLLVAESLDTAGVDFKKMKGQKKNRNYYRIRIGDYRIGIEYCHPTLIIMRIIHRGKVFNEFPPK